MEPEEIKLEFFKRRKQVMMKDVAARVGVTSTAVTRVIDRAFKSRRIAQGVADALGLPLEVVFHEYAETECVESSAAACN